MGSEEAVDTVEDQKHAEPEINMACASAASDSALPCPNACSWSAGCSAKRNTIRLTTEAAISSTESIKDASKLTDPVTHHAATLTTKSSEATAVAVQAAMVTKRAYSFSSRFPFSWVVRQKTEYIPKRVSVAGVRWNEPSQHCAASSGRRRR